MSDKQKQPLPKPIGPKGPLDQNQTGRRGIEPEEQHRHGGSRLPDQGGGKSGKRK